MLTIVLQQALQIGTNLWLKNWSQHNSESGSNANLTWYLGIYAAFGLGSSLMFLTNGLILYSFCVIRSAKSKFAQQLVSCLAFCSLSAFG